MTTLDALNRLNKVILDAIVALQTLNRVPNVPRARDEIARLKVELEKLTEEREELEAITLSQPPQPLSKLTQVKIELYLALLRAPVMTETEIELCFYLAADKQVQDVLGATLTPPTETIR